MLYDKHISLDPRLTTIADMLGTCTCCADIGSDHGRLGAFLLQNKRCRHVCLTDISAPSLEKARKLISLLGLKAQASFYVGDGALALQQCVDAAVIAGMGGETIAEIIEQSAGKLSGARLVLQPNVAAPQLRRRLNASGWSVVNEALVRDGRRIYVVIEAREESQQLSDREYEIGPVLLREKPAELRDYASFRLRVARKALEGASRGSDHENAAELRREIEFWEEMYACL